MRPSKRSAIVLFVILSLCSMAMAGTTSSIDADFNSTPISGGQYIWFSSSTQVMGLGNHAARVYVRNASVRFEANGIVYTIPVPDSDVTFDPATTLATTSFNTARNMWEVHAQPCCSSGNTFLAGAAFLVPDGGFPGGIQDVTWQADFSTDTAGVKLHWKWAAAVYTCFSTDYNALGVKPVDDDKNLSPRNKDNAGSPENVRNCVIGGAMGAGGTNYTGNYSKTTKINLEVNRPPAAITGGPYNGFVGKAIEFNAGASSDPDGDPLSFRWDFGDGATGSGATPSHTYKTAGSFNVTLTVSDGWGGTVTATTTANLVLPGAPTITAVISPPANVKGWNNTDVTVTFTCIDNVVGIASCPSPVVVTTEGPDQIVDGTATNNGGVSATAGVTVYLDRTPPAISQLTVPEKISLKYPGIITVETSDNQSIETVAISVNGNVLETLTAPPFTVTLSVPETAVIGDTLAIAAQVTDIAGNTATSTGSVPVVADVTTVVVGQVLSDATSLPIPSALVQVVGNPEKQAVSNADGRYSLSVTDARLFLQIGKESASMLTVEREVVAQNNAGTIPVDARLTPRSAGVTIDAAGGSLNGAALSVTVPADAVSAPTSFYLTRLSPQGLPGLLPLGWSPAAAFDLRADAAASGQFSAQFSQVPALPLHLAKYDFGIHGWIMTEAGLTSINGSLTVVLPTVGSYTLIVADGTNPPIIPPAGQPLAGVDMVSLPPEAVSHGATAPLIVAPSGGTAMGSLSVVSPVPLPSGTILQTKITENYTLKSGDPVILQERLQDIVFYQYPAPAGAALAAAFPVTPARTFQLSGFVGGKVHLDVMSGREGARGQTGGSAAAILQSGTATLSIAAGSLTQDTAISFGVIELDDFLPASDSLTPLAEFTMDFSGETLNIPAQLTMPGGSVAAGDTVVLARIERIAGVPRLIVVSMAEVTGETIVTQPYAGLPGIVAEGEYVFYRLAAPIGFVGGITTSNSEPVRALVQTDGLPFAAYSSIAGSYIVATQTGAVNLRAAAPYTALLGMGSAQVTAGETSALDIALVVSGETATVTPGDGAVGVPVTESVYIKAAKAFDPATVTSANITLQKTADGTAVAVRFVLTQGNTMVAVVPESVLDPLMQYTLEASGLMNTLGAPVAVPRVTFTTESFEAPVYSSNIGFSFPDTDGNVQISAPAGSFEPGTIIVIVDQSNGAVLSMTVGNDGSVTGWIPATTSDLMVITVTDPEGNQRTYTSSQFTDAEGNVAIGPGGGVVKGEGGVELRVPAGATDRGVVLKAEAFGPELFADRPDFPNGTFGAGLKVTSLEKAVFKKEVKLVFPKPADAPEGSFYYVYRRIENPNGTVSFETVDHAFVEGTGTEAKVVSASPPFPGLVGDLFGMNYYFLMWQYDATMIGVGSQGVIAGYVRRTVPPGPGQVDPTYDPIAGAKVYLSNDPAMGKVAYSQADGKYVLWDPYYGGGTRQVNAEFGNEAVEATAFESSTMQIDTTWNWGLTELAQSYRNIGHVNVDFPALAPQPPAPELDIRVFKVDQNGNRTEAGGMVIANTPLVFGINSNGENGPNIGMPNISVLGPQPEQLPTGYAPSGSNVQFLTTLQYQPGLTGTYTVKATALPSLGGAPISASKTFLVIAAGGSNTEVLNGIAPDIITDLSYPKDGATSLQVNLFPQITFTEPVVNVAYAGNVMLMEEGTNGSVPVPMKISAVGVDGNGNPVVIEDLQASPETPVTSITLQPLYGLKYSTKYTLTLLSQIVDQDKDTDGNPAPNGLKDAPRTISFTTFGPEQIAEIGDYKGAGVVVLGDRAYVPDMGYIMSWLHVLDISDPSTPEEVHKENIPARAFDVAGVEDSPITGGRMVAAAANALVNQAPSFVYFLDASEDVTKPVGATILASSMTEGVVTRIAMLRDKAYVLTSPKGIQVIDIGIAVDEFQTMVNQVGASGAITQLVSSQTGAYRGSITNTIPVSAGGWASIPLAGIAAGDFILDGSSQALVLATGSRVAPLIVTNPQLPGSSAILYAPEAISTAAGTLTSGASVTTGTAGEKQIAVVTGTGTVADGNGGQGPVGNVLVVFDLSNPRQPIPMGFVALDAYGKSATLAGGTIFIGTNDHAIMVSLTDPMHPVVSGEIDNFGGRLDISEEQIIIATDPNQTGVNLAMIKASATILNVTPSVIRVDDSGNTTRPIEVEVLLSGHKDDFKNSRLKLFEDDSEVDSIELGDLEPGLHSITVPAGKRIQAVPPTIEVTLISPDGSRTTPILMPLNSENYVPSDQTSGSDGTDEGSTNETGSGTEEGSASISLNTLSPNKIQQGSGDTVVSISGNFGTVPVKVFVRGLDLNWVEIPVTDASSNTGSFTIPGAMLSQPGFLEIGFVGNDYDEASIPLLVYDPALPVLGSLADIIPERVDVDASETSRPSTILLIGEGFSDGMRVVLGRGDTPGVILPTEVLDGATLRASIPFPFIPNADDIFGSVLSSDGTSLSQAIFYPRHVQMRAGGFRSESDSDLTITSINSDVDAKEARSISQFAETELGITSVRGGLKQTTKGANAQSSEPQKLIFQGNILPGTKALFQRADGASSTSIEAPLENLNVVATMEPYEPGMPSLGRALQLLRGEATVPEAITHFFKYYFMFVSEKAKSNEAPPKPAFEPSIPFGGKAEFIVYRGPKGDIAILTASEAAKTAYKEYKEDPSIELVIGDAGNNAYGKPLIQIEREGGQKKNRAWIRGIGLSLRPGDANGTKTKATLRTVVQNKEYTQSVVVLEGTLGNQHRFDPQILLAADKWEIPPQVLKSQALHESNGYTTNFRYEFTSLDLRKLTGDGNNSEAFVGLTELYKTEPWKHYMRADTVLNAYLPKSNEMDSARRTKEFPYDPQNPQIREFTLSNDSRYMVKRTVGKTLGIVQGVGRNEVDPFVTACIVTLDVQACPQNSGLTLVRGDKTWQKNGGMNDANGNPINSDVIGDAITDLGSNEFSVDYEHAKVKIGTDLALNQKLLVHHWTVGYEIADNRPADYKRSNKIMVGNQTVVHVDNGKFATDEEIPDLNNPNIVLEHPKLTYFVKDPDNSKRKLFYLLKENRKTMKGFLTAEDTGDRQVEFKYNALGELEPRDPRYRVITAQPFASSSYGVLQATLTIFNNSKLGQALKEVFDPSDPLNKKIKIYDLLPAPDSKAPDPNKIDPQFEITARHHAYFKSILLRQPTFQYCEPLTPCTEDRWKKQWKQIVKKYNSGGPVYQRGEIIDNAFKYHTPKPMQ